MMMKSNLQIIKDSYLASKKGEPDKIVADFSPSCEWIEMEGSPYAGTYVGPAMVLAKVFQKIGSEWEDFACTPDAFYDAGATIVVTGWYSGTYKASGKRLRCRVTHIWKIVDGKIQGFEQFADTLLFNLAMRLN